MYTEVRLHSYDSQDLLIATKFAWIDLSTTNLTHASRRLPHVSEEELFEVLGLPSSEKVIRSHGKPLDEGVPPQLTKSTEWPG